MRLTQELLRHRQVEDPTPFFKIVTAERVFERAVEDLNPRHQVLETCVLPTELTAHLNDYKRHGDQKVEITLQLYRSKRCFTRVAFPTLSLR